MNQERVIYKIYEDLIQSACEANLGRELTETELKRLPCIFIDSDKFFGQIYGALIEAGEEAMNDEGWEQWDKNYKDATLEEIIK